MYNQPTHRLPNGRSVGTLYKNPIDCLWKTFKVEGVRGWYKGPANYSFFSRLLLKLHRYSRIHGPFLENRTSYVSRNVFYP